jgi:hypothetical protein
MTPTRHVPGSIALGTRLERCTEVPPPRPGPGLERSPDPWARLAKRTAGVPPSPTARSDVLSSARRPPTRHHLECRPSPEPARLVPRRNLPRPRRSGCRGATARSGVVSWSVDPRSRETVNHRAVCSLSSTCRCRPIAPRCLAARWSSEELHSECSPSRRCSVDASVVLRPVSRNEGPCPSMGFGPLRGIPPVPLTAEAVDPLTR